jgi:hypothetical protein
MLNKVYRFGNYLIVIHVNECLTLYFIQRKVYRREIRLCGASDYRPYSAYSPLFFLFASFINIRNAKMIVD